MRENPGRLLDEPVSLSSGQCDALVELLLWLRQNSDALTIEDMEEMARGEGPAGELMQAFQRADYLAGAVQSSARA